MYLPLGEREREEHNFLSGVSFQNERRADLEEHFRSVKGALEALATHLNVGRLTFEPGRHDTAPWQTPGCFIDIRLNDSVIGGLGFLSDPLLAEIAPKSQVVWFELNFDALEGPIFPETSYEATSRYPGSWFDFSIVASAESGFVELIHTLDTFSHPFLKRREFITLYKGKGLAEGTGSYTFRYWIESKDSTLTSEQIESFQQEYITFLKSQGLSLR